METEETDALFMCDGSHDSQSGREKITSKRGLSDGKEREGSYKMDTFGTGRRLSVPSAPLEVVP